MTPPTAAGELLSELELIHNCIFLLNAGHETTTNLIGNSVDLLLRNPDAARTLPQIPKLIDTAIEEFLRMESPNQLGNRRAVRDAKLGDVAIAAGSYVHLCIAAANRDPAQFPDPDRLDIRRSPDRNLAFGLGIHACAGMSLARMEARIAICKLVNVSRRSSGPATSCAAAARAFAAFCIFRSRCGSADAARCQCRRTWKGIAMSANPAHMFFCGSIPLEHEVDVFRTLAEIGGERLRRVPDGELGDRKMWVIGQYAVLARFPALEFGPFPAVNCFHVGPHGVSTWMTFSDTLATS